MDYRWAILHCHQSGGDEFNGTHSRWTVPLGQRVRAKKVPEIPELHFWLVELHLLAILRRLRLHVRRTARLCPSSAQES